MNITVIGRWGAYPKQGEATAGYLLEHDDKKILIDCGSGVLSLLPKFTKVTDLTAVMITHSHFDHIADLGCLQYACLIDTDLDLRKEPLPIYIAGSSNPYKTMKGSKIGELTDSSVIDIGEMKISFFKTFHEVYCLGVKASYAGKTFIYTADTYYDESLVDFCKNADVLIAESSFYASFDNAKNFGHMNTMEVGTLANKAHAKKLVLTHLPHFGEVETLVTEVKESYDGEVLLAHVGLQVSV